MPFWDPKRKRERGPKKYLHPKQESMAVRILDMIEKTGGMTRKYPTQAQKYAKATHYYQPLTFVRNP